MKNIIEYITCVCLAFVFAHYLYGRGGVLIATVMLIAAFGSLLLDVYCRKKISVELKGGRLGYFSKGDKATIELTVSKTTRLMTPFIEIIISASDNLELAEDERKIRLALVNRRSETVSKSLTAVGCGGGHIEVSKVLLCDYLGFMRLELPVRTERLEVGILPDIVDIVPDRELLRSAVDTDSDDDDEEKEAAATTYIFNGTAGYEHRQYIPGDPLKKVNWKLSSKRGELLVRLDEQLVSSSRVFLLDISPQGFGFVPRDRIIQSCFAVALSMMRSGYECELYFYDGEPCHLKLTPQDDPQHLQTLMSRAMAVPEGTERIPPEVFSDGRGATVFTDERAPAFFHAAASLVPENAVCFITYSLAAPLTGNMWGVDDEMEFHKL